MSDCCQALPSPGHLRRSEVDTAGRPAWWRVGVSALIAGNSMLLALAINLSEARPDERLLVGTLLLFGSLVVLGLLGRSLAGSSWRAVRERRISIELLFCMGIMGAIAASTVSLWRGHGAIYYEVASILLVIYESGRHISGAARRRALGAGYLGDVDGARFEVETAAGVVWKTGSQLCPGDAVRTVAGGRVPVDGVLLDPAAFVTDSELSGEPGANVRRAGDMIWAGTRAVDALRVSARSVMGQRELDRLEASVERAMRRPSSIERQADRVARRFVPAVAAIAGVTFAVWAWQASWDRALFNAMAVLLVACPCALGFATPLAVWLALGQWARRGLVAEAGDVVEKLASVDTVVFDKTGTLTDPDSRSVRLRALGVERAWLTALIRAVEASTVHPLAAALHSSLDSTAPATDFQIEEARNIAGRGVAAVVRAAEARFSVVIGTPEIVSDVQEQALLRATAGELGATAASWVVAITVDERLRGVAVLDESVSEDLPAMLSAIEGLGLGVVLLTGDGVERAERLGVAQVLCRQTPEDKRQQVENLAAQGRRVLFVGDGSNDAAAMAASEVSIAVAGGSSLPRQVAGLVWHGRCLATIPWAITRARATRQVIRSNLMLAAAYNIIGMSAAAAGLLHPILAALLMLGSSLTVIGRTLAVAKLGG